MRAAKCGGSSSTFPFFAIPKNKFITTSTRRKISVVAANKEDSSSSNVKTAKLFAAKKDRMQLPNFNGNAGGERIYHIRDFLNQPSGVQAMLNTSALQSFEFLATNTYRCTLPKLSLLNFEVAPVMVLRVTPSNEDCTVEMLSCKFEGSEVLQQQNQYFSASMRNCITWDAEESGPCLDIDVKLNITLEIYTRPFNMLPVSTIEGPGNVLMQALLDRLVPLLLQQLVQDYEKWVQQQR